LRERNSPLKKQLVSKSSLAKSKSVVTSTIKSKLQLNQLSKQLLRKSTSKDVKGGKTVKSKLSKSNSMLKLNNASSSLSKFCNTSSATSRLESDTTSRLGNKNKTSTTLSVFDSPTSAASLAQGSRSVSSKKSSAKK